MKHRKNQQKVIKSKYPSDFGSHTSMIDENYAKFNTGDHGYIVCKDGRGSYVTAKKSLDNGRSDYNRSTSVKIREAALKEKLEGVNE